MENNAATVESDVSNYTDMQKQLMEMKEAKKGASVEAPKEEVQETVVDNEPKIKKYVFRKGDQTFEIDEDSELEMTADKKPVKLTLKELKDRAAGDIAVKNRMHSLAEEKKKVQATLKEFATLAKKDPLAALEYISTQAKEADSEFEYKQYLSSLAEQAERLGKMDEKEMKAYELEKKLNKAEQDLSLKEREAAVVRRKQELLSEFPEIGDQQFGQMVDEVLNNPVLSEGIENENDLMDVVDELVRETLTQRDIMSVIHEINPEYEQDNELIFSLSEQIKKNPDLEEDDIRDIINEVIKPQEKARASQVLSQKRRASDSVDHKRYQNASEYELMKMKLLEEREKSKQSKR